ncbi:hypothetical protein ACFLWE_00930 [Chloroflexota bacterium]
MEEQNKSILTNLKDTQSLRYFLKSESSVDGSDGEEVMVKIKVYNDAPTSPDGGDIVFLGVGLRIIDGREGGGEYKPPGINESRPSDRNELRGKYREGRWFGGRSDSFPEVTSDEQSWGEVLFPGESVVYEIMTLRAALPYLDVRVEGSVSRRHLFHISQPTEALKAWTQPLLIETIRAIEAIDFSNPLLSLTNTMPTFGPQTTLGEIAAFKAAVVVARDHNQKVWMGTGDIKRSAPNQKFRDYLGKDKDNSLGQYFLLVMQAYDRTLGALSGGDMKKISEAAEELKSLVLRAEEVKRTLVQLKSQFGIAP